jgi:hypothetical protein
LEWKWREGWCVWVSFRCGTCVQHKDLASLQRHKSTAEHKREPFFVCAQWMNERGSATPAPNDKWPPIFISSLLYMKKKKEKRCWASTTGPLFVCVGSIFGKGESDRLVCFTCHRALEDPAKHTRSIDWYYNRREKEKSRTCIAALA